MKQILTLIRVDLKQILRDSTLTSFLFIPFALLAFVRYFVPYISAKFPFLEPYYSHIMMLGSNQTAIMYGFISSFIILDEKDQNVLQVIRVLPISPFYFITYRLAFATFFSTIAAFLMINLGGVAFPGTYNAVLLSIQYGLTAPIITLIIATFAKNKVEGMAIFKGVSLVLLLPMASLFIAGNIRYLFAIIPAFWTYNLYQNSMTSGNNLLYFLWGMVVYFLVILLLYKQFRKRVFDR